VSIQGKGSSTLGLFRVGAPGLHLLTALAWHCFLEHAPTESMTMRNDVNREAFKPLIRLDMLGSSLDNINQVSGGSHAACKGEMKLCRETANLQYSKLTVFGVWMAKTGGMTCKQSRPTQGGAQPLCGCLRIGWGEVTRQPFPLRQPGDLLYKILGSGKVAGQLSVRFRSIAGSNQIHVSLASQTSI